MPLRALTVLSCVASAMVLLGCYRSHTATTDRRDASTILRDASTTDARCALPMPVGPACTTTSDCLAIVDRALDCTQQCICGQCVSDAPGGTPNGIACGGGSRACLEGECIAACSASGEMCESTADCCSGGCIGGICESQCRPPGAPCAASVECCGGLCHPTGFCLSSEPGQAGAVCNVNEDCFSVLCVAGVCRNGLPACGDGHLDRYATPPEYCDDGNTNDVDACNNSCTRLCMPPAPPCSDGDPCNGDERCRSTGTALCTTTAGLADGTPCAFADGRMGYCSEARCVVL